MILLIDYILSHLSAESVIEIYKKEKSKWKCFGAFVQFGGQTPLKIAKEIEVCWNKNYWNINRSY